MIIVTGGAGFIGSNLVNQLNIENTHDILIVEEPNTYTKKFENLKNLKYLDCIDKDTFIKEIQESPQHYIDKTNCIFHLGACSKTTEPDREYIMNTNFEFSKNLLKFSSNNKIPLIYASSASVYGNGTKFKEHPNNESFLNHYAESKLLLDTFYRENASKISSQVVGLRYFNVFGPRENHKEGMSSVVFHFYNQMKNSGEIKLFKGSHGFNDGEQRRDFICVEDTIKVKKWFQNHQDISGIYNVGTGISRTFNDIANCVLTYFGKGKIKYIDFPNNLINQYQAFTEADITHLQSKGFNERFTTLEKGVSNYLDWLSNNT